MKKQINHFQTLLNSYFRDLTLATAYLEIGHKTILNSPQNASIRLTLASDIITEPMFLRELLQHSPAVSLGIAELFQTKAIAAWLDLLNALFEHFVKLHMEGTSNFPILKKRSTRLDFSSPLDLNLQVRQGLATDFAFGKYADRIKTISQILVPDENIKIALEVIRKHVAIRNATQHHAGKVYEEMLRDLGVNTVNVLDHNGNPFSLEVNQPIGLYVPELDNLKSSLFIITNQWKTKHV